MNTSSDNRGYTIVEVMIFIVVSGFLLMSALIMFNGRQEQVQYEQGMRNIDFKLQDTINSVSNGHFSQTGFDCVNDGSPTLRLTTGSEAQGTSDHCVFAGKAIEKVNDTSYRITTILAAKPASIGTPMSLRDANAKLTAFTARSEVIGTSWGLKIMDIVDESGNPIDAALFLSELGNSQSGSTSIMGSGVQSINLYTANSLNDSTPIALHNPPRRPVFICIEDQNGGKRGVITLGADSRELTTSINQDVKPGETPCA